MPFLPTSHACPWTECTLSNFADNAGLGGVADLLKSRESVQRDLEKLGDLANRNFLKLSSETCKVLHWRQENPIAEIQTGNQLAEPLSWKGHSSYRGCCVEYDPRCALTAKKVNCILGYLRHSRVRRSKDVVTPSIQCWGGHVWILCPVLGITHRDGVWSKSAELSARRC